MDSFKITNLTLFCLPFIFQEVDMWQASNIWNPTLIWRYIIYAIFDAYNPEMTANMLCMNAYKFKWVVGVLNEIQIGTRLQSPRKYKLTHTHPNTYKPTTHTQTQTHIHIYHIIILTEETAPFLSLRMAHSLGIFIYNLSLLLMLISK